MANAVQLRRDKLAAKRQRNKTGVIERPRSLFSAVSSPSSSARANKDHGSGGLSGGGGDGPHSIGTALSGELSNSMNSLSDLARVAEMRKEIVGLQKAHIIELKQNLREHREENSLLMDHVARLEEELADVKMTQQRERRQSRELGVGGGGISAADLEFATALQNERDELLSERDLAVEKLTKLTEVLRSVSGSRSGIEAMRLAELASDALNDGGATHLEQVLALEEIAASSPSWNDLDDRVTEANRQLDRSLQARRGTATTAGHKGKAGMAAGGGSGGAHSAQDKTSAAALLAALRKKVQPKLDKLVHTSNSLKIRVQATIPGTVAPVGALAEAAGSAGAAGPS